MKSIQDKLYEITIKKSLNIKQLNIAQDINFIDLINEINNIDKNNLMKKEDKTCALLFAFYDKYENLSKKKTTEKERNVIEYIVEFCKSNFGVDIANGSIHLNKDSILMQI